MANTIKIGNIEASSVMIGNSAVSAVYIGSTKIYPSGGTVDYSKQYLTFEVVNGGNITITASHTDVAKTIQYSIDNGSTWTSLTTSTTAQELGGTLNVGDKVLVKGTNTAYSTSSYYNSFGGTAKVNVYGNIMSLISGDSFENNKTLTDSYTFKKLFHGYANLLLAENLVLTATKLATYCYSYMFQGCTSLTTAPELPATTLAGRCYSDMFSGCTSLTTAPELPATTLAEYCYSYMFNGCKNIKTAPTLPATTLASGCYNFMFYGTNVLPDCSNIDFTSKAVLDSGGLIGLFAGTKVTDSDLDRLLPKNANGKYYLPVTTLASNCYSDMFNGCTSLTTAPELPATTLAYACYQYMFKKCTSLTKAPVLPATTLADNCYYYMFNGCTSLNYIKCLATDISARYCLNKWVENVASSGTFVKNASMTSWTTGVNGIPTGWTVVTE